MMKRTWTKPQGSDLPPSDIRQVLSLVKRHEPGSTKHQDITIHVARHTIWFMWLVPTRSPLLSIAVNMRRLWIVVPMVALLEKTSVLALKPCAVSTFRA
jgi:hypothetical protein